LLSYSAGLLSSYTASSNYHLEIGTVTSCNLKHSNVQRGPLCLVRGLYLIGSWGNPAAVVFLDLNLPIDTLAGIVCNFNQRITTLLSQTPLPSSNDTAAAFGVRWFTPSNLGHYAATEHLL